MKKVTPFIHNKPDKVNKPKKDNRAITIIMLAGALLIMTSLFMGFYAICKWFDTNRVVFKAPIVIKLQAPITVKKRVKPNAKSKKKAGVVKKVMAVEKSEYEIVMAQKHGAILWNIYQLESGRGGKDVCRLNNNGYGGFGVMVDGQVYCYPTFTKAAQRASYWFDKLYNDTLVEALCEWNTGVAGQVNCHYYQSYLSL